MGLRDRAKQRKDAMESGEPQEEKKEEVQPEAPVEEEKVEEAPPEEEAPAEKEVPAEEPVVAEEPEPEPEPEPEVVIDEAAMAEFVEKAKEFGIAKNHAESLFKGGYQSIEAIKDATVNDLTSVDSLFRSRYSFLYVLCRLLSNAVHAG
jgi:hypothetical protein